MKLFFQATIIIVLSSIAWITEATPVQGVTEAVQISPQAPEPAILLLFGAGIMGLTGVVRRRK